MKATLHFALFCLLAGQALATILGGPGVHFSYTIKWVPEGLNPAKHCGGDFNAVFDRCGSPCPLTCENYGKKTSCKLTCIKGGGCCCKPGYVLNYLKKCIPLKECPKCGPNEYFCCGSACDTHCSTLGQKCPIVNVKCTERCYCIDGYARNAKGVCIPQKQCPPKKCPPNQIINLCPYDCPPEKTCATYIINYIIDCARPPPQRICNPKCVCKPGYIRRETNGDCVLPSECCDDKNAEMVNCPNPCPGGTCDLEGFINCKLPCVFRGCQCKKGSVKNNAGKCIPISQCPPKCTGPNEVYSSCKDPCPDACKYIISDIPKPFCLPPFPCPGGCNCLPGYVRNEFNICVKPENCQCKDPNAVVVACPNPCPGGTCEQQEFSLCKAACKAYGCQCKNGYVLNSQGICVPIFECPAKCTGPNEVSVACVNTCPDLCIYITTTGPFKPCPVKGPCVKGCDCLPGYVRNENYVCVKPTECGCPDSNAVVVLCPNPCPGGTCQNPDYSSCSLTCKTSGCTCRPGYVKNSNGICTPITECPAICTDPNEISVACVDTCPKLCSYVTNSGAQPKCDIKPCQKGCDCRPGYYRNNKNVCVPVEQCSCVDPNAIVVPCPNPCSGGTCLSPEYASCSLPCKEFGCQCIQGFVKDSEGKCILIDDCPAICVGPHEVSVPCVDNCPLKCTAVTSDVPEPPCPPKGKCVKGCDCEEGYRRNNNNVCVLITQCDCPDPNAVIVPCPNPCFGGTCEQPTYSDCNVPCKVVGCQCKTGYVKDDTGKCILQSECPKCDGPNEEFKYCGSWCQATCDDKSPTCREVCVKGCFCKIGYVRNNEVCIPIESCPPPLNCSVNEVPNKCPKPCPPPQRCDQYLNGIESSCLPVEKFDCIPRCDCIPGYIRNNKGVCVLPENCCQDENAEVTDCTDTCPIACDNLENLESLVCSKDCFFKKCSCKNGYVIGPNGKCILQKECPPKPCGENEKYNPCPGYCSFDPTCETIFSGLLPVCGIPPIDRRKCIPRCECLEGFVRTNGICVSRDTCCNDVNAQVSPCPMPCDELCFQSPAPGCQVLCKYFGCRCKEGFVRGPFDTCIALKDCPVCGVNEEFKVCGSKCEATCGNTSPICEKGCNAACFCKPGYIRYNGVCILISDCPAVCTGPNEVSVPCVDTCPKICSSITDVTYLLNCLVKGPCEKGCNCAEGYVRNSQNICVKPEECPCPDPNASVVQCPNPCPGGTCLIPSFSPCRMACKDYGCQCDLGYVKNADGVCILLEDCPAICTGQNEISVPCADSCPSLCSYITNLGIKPDCLVNVTCFKGCNCAPGYHRNSQNICVPPTECSCLDPNAEVVACPNPCSGGTCKSPEFAPCNIPCVPFGCQCKNGFVKDEFGKCIPLDDCPAICVGPNEVSVPCVNNCPLRCSAVTNSEAVSCENSEKCVKGCDCIPGFYRNKNNICVSVNQCDCPDPNAEVVSCPNPCPGGTCELPSFLSCSLPCKAVGCECKNGYVKDENNKCIRIVDCPKCEDPNEEYKYCGSWCQATCDNKEPTCRDVCVKGCFCKPGYIRHDGVCILIESCPPPLNCSINEVPNKCPKPCPLQKTCDEYLNGLIDIVCFPIEKYSCVPICECAPGYLRNYKGVCVLPEDCCRDPNAVVIDCPSNPCPLTCDNLENYESLVCLKKCPFKQCACKDGYVLGPNGLCIPQTECPPKPCGPFEEYNSCPDFCYFDKTCEYLLGGITQLCAELPINRRKCIPKCVCIDGYVRTNGICVPESTCCNDVNAEVVPCPVPCDTTCFLSPIPSCVVSCAREGCKCKDGFVRGPFDLCISPKDCPVCGANEEYNICGPQCQPTCEDNSPTCPKICKPGCVCKAGYIRYKGECFPIGDCPAVCTGPNEVSVPCVNTCPLLCIFITSNIIPKCPPLGTCVKGCDCLPGYYRNSENICVKPEECQCADPNAAVISCPNPCPGGTCISPSFSLCKTLCKDYGCQCLPGYVLDSFGVCILEEDCPAICTGPNEVSVPCKSLCPNVCSTVTGFGPPGFCELIKPCIKGCDCIEGYYRNMNYICVPVEQCDCLDPNAEVVLCPNPCPGGTCASPGFVSCNLPCAIAGCQCKPGYVKDSAGLCILIQDCPTICINPNEVSVKCVNSCPGKCSAITSNVPIPECPPNPICVKGCDCAPGYQRNDKNICVKTTECDCVDPNASVVPCPNPCSGGTCASPEFAACDLVCKPFGCQCNKGYVKDYDGNCVLLESCPRCDGPNEEYNVCGTWCPPQCDNQNPPCRDVCVKGCFCKPGYIRNDGVCIAIKDCPPPLNCSVNEVPNKCPKPCPPQKTCDQYLNGLLDLVCFPFDKYPCVPICECAPGYLRNYKGVCVLPEDCCRDPNAEVTDCPNPCPLSCDNLENFESILCLKKCPFKGCSCKKGYVIGPNGLCIPQTECPPKLCPANEVYDPCPDFCSFDLSCLIVIEGFTPSCLSPLLIDRRLCIPRCKCIPGYVRINGICVPKDKCCNDDNAEIVSCPANCDATCEGSPPPGCQLGCIFSACKCKSGFVRGPYGLCISPKDCPVCDVNEEFKACGTQCEATCDNRLPICLLGCKPGCVCRPGYIRHEGKCILTDDCPLPCFGANEEYQSCGTACEKTCENKDKSIICTENCVKGCFCKPGYVRNFGICIKIENCPTCQGPNEEYLLCGPSCPETCENKGKFVLCPFPICVPGCFCQKGYILKNGKCVLIEDCRPDCGPYQVWSNSAPDCPEVCGSIGLFRCTTTKPGCVCVPGYIRDIFGNCIPDTFCKIPYIY